jgi:predicted transcriptional regulator
MTFSKLQYLKALHGEKMKDSTFRVMVTVFNYTNEEGLRAYPGNARLAEDCNTSVSTVKRALKELVELGWLVHVKRGGRAGDGTHFSGEYALGYRFLGESQQVTHDPTRGQNGRVKGSSRYASTGQFDDVKGSDREGQWTTGEPPSDHVTTDHETTDHY